jgi:hypothetical protein
MEPENSQGGIGGINATISVQVPLEPGLVVPGQVNTVDFRLNGTNGVVSGIRVVDFDFLDSDYVGILSPGYFIEEDPDTWTSPSLDPIDIAAGADLWSNATIVDDPINNIPIKAKCASCHFVDGSDLKYFNYSNGSITTRSRFHGLSQLEGEQIASSIRSSSVNVTKYLFMSFSRLMAETLHAILRHYKNDMTLVWSEQPRPRLLNREIASHRYLIFDFHGKALFRIGIVEGAELIVNRTEHGSDLSEVLLGHQ